MAINPYSPESPIPGFRFLIQLMDAQNEEQARSELKAMFGERVMKMARLTKGTKRIAKGGGPNKIRWEDSPKGFRVYIPKDLGVGD